MRLLIALFVALLAYTSLALLVSPDTRQSLIMQSSILGIETGEATGNGSGWKQVLALDPEGAAAEAGINAGDAIRFDQFRGETLTWPAGTSVGVDVLRGDDQFRTQIIARAPAPVSEGAKDITRILNEVLNLLVVGFILLLAFRGRHSRLALMMAAMFALMCYIPCFILPAWPGVMEFGFLADVLSNTLMTCFWALFCLEMTGGPSSKTQTRWVAAILIVLTATTIWVASAAEGLIPSFGINLGAILGGFVIVSQGLGYAIIATNYPRTDPATRNRIKIIVCAFIALMIAYTFGNAGLLDTLGLSITFNSLRLLALILLTYSLLHQRLFDLGFAVNRTLVYGAAAFTLLCIFGLVEYIAKSMIPVAWPTAGPFISAGIAVLLFLMFHRLHHWFEHHIERLFFGEWYRAEAALKRFV